MQVWSIDYTLPFKHGQICKHCFYCILFDAGIHKKVNFDIGRNWGKIYVWGTFRIAIYGIPIFTNQYFSAFFCLVWSWNYKSYFGHFEICYQCFYYRISRTVLNRKISFSCWPFFSYFLLVNMSWMSYYFRYLNYANILDMSKRLSIVYVWSLLVFSFMESLVLTIFWTVNFCLVFKLFKSSLQIMQFIPGHLIFLGSVDIGGYLIATLFGSWILTHAHFSIFFSDL